MIADDAAKTKLARYFKLKLKDCRGDYDITITTNDQRQILRYYVHEARYRLLPEEVCPEVKTLSTEGSVAWWLVRYLFSRLLTTEHHAAMVCFETATKKAIVQVTGDGRFRCGGQ